MKTKKDSQVISRRICFCAHTAVPRRSGESAPYDSLSIKCVSLSFKDVNDALVDVQGLQCN